MKYLKTFENMDIDPFGEEEWEERDTAKQSVYRLKLGVNRVWLQKLDFVGYRLYNDGKRVVVSEEGIESVIKDGKFHVDFIGSVRYFAKVYFGFNDRDIKYTDYGLVKDLVGQVEKDFIKSYFKIIRDMEAALDRDNPGDEDYKLMTRISDIKSQYRSVKNGQMKIGNTLKKEIYRVVKGLPRGSRGRTPVGFIMPPPVDESISIDPFGEEDWDEEKSETIDSILDNHLKDYKMSINWLFDNYDKEQMEEFADAFIDNDHKLDDEFVEKWKYYFEWENIHNVDIGDLPVCPSKYDFPVYKLLLEFDDGSDVFFHFSIKNKKHIGGQIVFNDNRWSDNTKSYKMYNLMNMEREPLWSGRQEWNRRKLDHDYNLEYFIEKLDIDLDI